MTNRVIAKAIGVHHSTVGNYLRKNNLVSNGNCRVAIDRVDDENIRCSKCKIVKKQDEFLFNRKGKKYEYQFTYCMQCRKEQSYKNLNSDINKFLSDKYNRVKLSAKNKGIPFSISKESFLNIYTQQKGLCFYTDKKMVWGVGKGRNRNSLSVDKIVPKNGYVEGNVVFCRSIINTCKNDISLDEMQNWMPEWHKRIMKMWRSLGLTCFQVADGDF